MRQQIWDDRYTRFNATDFAYDDWLGRWKGLLDTARPRRVLDLGCGVGFDTIFMETLGLPVVGCDLSMTALKRGSMHRPSPAVLQCDVADGLPFRSHVFGAIVANLSLHYFPLSRMGFILRSIRRCLPLHGHLIARFNAAKSPRTGTANRNAVSSSDLREGIFRVFYDRKTLVSLSHDGWEIVSLAEAAITRYGRPKSVLEIVVRNVATE